MDIILQKGQIVNNEYTVLLFIKQGSSAQTYRVKDKKGNVRFLKLFNLSMSHPTSCDKDGTLLEIKYLMTLNHQNIVKYYDGGEVIIESKKYAYLILEFISGETLLDKLMREQTISSFDIKEYAKGILTGLDYIHSLSEPIIHNEMTAQNVMLDLSADIPVPKIIDFGYARSFLLSARCYNRDGLNPFYLAPECYNNSYSPQSDIFSVGVLMYHLYFGILPWAEDISTYKSNQLNLENAITKARSKTLNIPNTTVPDFDFDESLIRIIKKAVCNNSEDRFKDAAEMISALNDEIEVIDPDFDKKNIGPSKTNMAVQNRQFAPKAKGHGFDRIAGMKELKQKLYNDVIELLNDREGAEKYGLSIPNGMLLYGPPGCGKTFFAERFAEEAGFNYKYIRSSDLASIYVHGSQEKIGKLFQEARENAPTILCFDELDALVPSRDKVHNASQSGEVNEFLSQLNNCGEDGIFVIGTTNNPNSIDPAVLRSGRIDIKVFIPVPDFEARKALFELYLKDKPLDFGIDYSKLASLTENYVISDIVFIIQEVGRSVFKTRERITLDKLELFISKIKSSVKADEISRYEQIRNKLEGETFGSEEQKRTPIGFKTNGKS